MTKNDLKAGSIVIKQGVKRDGDVIDLHSWSVYVTLELSGNCQHPENQFSSDFKTSVVVPINPPRIK